MAAKERDAGHRPPELLRKHANTFGSNLKDILAGDGLPAVRRFVFPYRKRGDLLTGRTRETIFRAIRPTGNVLPGYEPSGPLDRVMEEAG